VDNNTDFILGRYQSCYIHIYVHVYTIEKMKINRHV